LTYLCIFYHLSIHPTIALHVPSIWSNMIYLFFIINLLIIEVLIYSTYLVEQLFQIQISFRHWVFHFFSGSHFNNIFQQTLFCCILSRDFFFFNIFTFSFTDITTFQCSYKCHLHGVQSRMNSSHIFFHNWIFYKSVSVSSRRNDSKFSFTQRLI